MNYFFAILLPQEVREKTVAFHEHWRALLGPEFRARWLAPDDYHITLKFLGCLAPSQESALIAAARPVAANSAPLTVAPVAAGAFPGLSHPRVLWTGVQPSTELTRLAAELDGAMISYGVTPESGPYRPHITLARCDPRLGQAILNGQIPGEQAFGTFRADEFVLMQTLPPESRRNGSKARYNTVQTFPFDQTGER